MRRVKAAPGSPSFLPPLRQSCSHFEANWPKYNTRTRYKRCTISRAATNGQIPLPPPPVPPRPSHPTERSVPTLLRGLEAVRGVKGCRAAEPRGEDHGEEHPDYKHLRERRAIHALLPARHRLPRRPANPPPPAGRGRGSVSTPRAPEARGPVGADGGGGAGAGGRENAAGGMGGGRAPRRGGPRRDRQRPRGGGRPSPHRPPGKKSSPPRPPAALWEPGLWGPGGGRGRGREVRWSWRRARGR